MTPSWLRGLLVEPYRLFFGIGVMYAIIAMGTWAAWLLWPGHIPAMAAVPLISLHAHVMIYGVVGFYVFGFLLTAFPRWTNQPSLSSKSLLFLVGSFFFGQVALLGAAIGGDRSFLIIAGVMETASYVALLLILMRWYVKSSLLHAQAQSRPWSVIVALVSATVGVLFFYAQLCFPMYPMLQTASGLLGVYAYLLFLVVAITYRIVPYFAGRVIANYEPRQGKHTLTWVIGLIAVHIIAALVIDYRIAWMADVILIGVLLREWIGWFSRGIPRIPILFVLFVGFFWILIFLGFSGVELVRTVTLPFGLAAPIFRTPALHALLVGAFSTLLIAISTRVVRGHGGLPIRADKSVLIALALIQIAALIRVIVPIVAVFVSVPSGFLYVSAGLWTLAFFVWAIRYIPVLGRVPVSTVA